MNARLPDVGVSGADAGPGDSEELGRYTPRFDVLSLSTCNSEGCAVGAELDGSLTLIVSASGDHEREAWWISSQPPGKACVVRADEESFKRWLSGATGTGQASSMLEVGVEGGRSEVSGSAETLSLEEASRTSSEVVRTVKAALLDAMREGASDVHFESTPDGMMVKFRVDGVLTPQFRVHGAEVASRVISRIKVSSELDIAERRLPQDGRMQVLYQGRSVDLRVSVMPSIHGEDAVLRILDRKQLTESLQGLSLEKLGLGEVEAERVRSLCRRSHGLVLVTGPTGSGKTTTLYAAIAETRNRQEKIVTIEDPVEYQLDEVLQIPVNDRKGLTFARGLRSILRHDPDKILVGEIRDSETAQIAVQAALTGHLVLTTIHANSSFDAVGRFAQLGISEYDFAAAVTGIVSQRLIRKLCGTCAQRVEGGLRRRPVGCSKCRGTGFSGRFAAAEVLEVDDEIRAVVSKRSTYKEFEAAARPSGWRRIEDVARAACEAGVTCDEEVERVVR